MKLYRTHTGHWAGNQDDARALAKAYDTEWEPCEVPDNKAGLLAFLNEHSVGADKPTQIVYRAEPVTPAKPEEPKELKGWTRLDMEEAILSAPLETAVALAELVMSRIRDFTRGK